MQRKCTPKNRAVASGTYSYNRPERVSTHDSPGHDDGSPELAPVTSLANGEARHAVYFITTRDMAPLYIGSTSQLIRRLRMHAKQRDWFTQDCRIFVEWFRNRDAAYLRETNAIYMTRPIHNQRVDTPTGPSPTPDVPLRPLLDPDRDLADLCTNCSAGHIRSGGLCHPCYSYRERYDADRPEHMWGEDKVYG